MNAVITGGTKGIGRAIADLLASKGINLFVCSRNESDLEEMKFTLEKNNNSKVQTTVVDMSIKAEVQTFAANILKNVEQVDILVNNAGMFIPGALADEEDGALEQMINTNLYSAYYLTRALLPSMMDRRNGHIFNICSVASKIAYPNGGSYSISKFALLGFSKVLREELKDNAIKVTSVLPGATWSNSWAGINLPRERLMEANDIAIAIWGALQMSTSAVVEEIVLRPQLGDL
ncbi:SDR family oxidoreductase [Saprospiraceae bacterium]|nr:SDR family oxidoreductase [Saprospiraceae bacterium]MDC1306101.1 SDR family oxidoreductase [Saprospiraceae bacterium]